MGMTKAEIKKVIDQYVDEKYFNKDKLLKYLDMHQMVGNEIFEYCDKDLDTRLCTKILLYREYRFISIQLNGRQIVSRNILVRWIICFKITTNQCIMQRARIISRICIKT